MALQIFFRPRTHRRKDPPAPARQNRLAVERIPDGGSNTDSPSNARRAPGLLVRLASLCYEANQARRLCRRALRSPAESAQSPSNPRRHCFGSRRSRRGCWRCFLVHGHVASFRPTQAQPPRASMRVRKETSREAILRDRAGRRKTKPPAA